ncbi:MAG: aldo/keto reductase [Micropruina glycogenica]
MTSGAGARDCRTALAGSLERLGRDRIDLYWAHVEDSTVPVDDLVGTFGGRSTKGLIGRYGVSNHPSWLVERLRGAAERAGLPALTAYQQRFSYFQPLPGVPVEGQPMRLGMLSPDRLDAPATPASPAGSTPPPCSAATTAPTGPCLRVPAPGQ